jgi:hypothetical protein
MKSQATSGNDAFELPREIAESYIDLRKLPDGRYIGTLRLMFHWTMHIDIDYAGYADRYCFATYELAKKAFDEWSGQGDPEGWHRHPTTGRRKDLTSGREWVDF